VPVKCAPPANGRDRVRAWQQAMRFTPDLDERATIVGLVGHPTRLRAFYVIEKLGEVCVCDLADILGVTQSAVSQHLAKFKAYGLVTARRDAQTLFYRLADSPDVARLRRACLEGIEVSA
jgi:DNA-binding transcriptional ArsR family regulator